MGLQAAKSTKPAEYGGGYRLTSDLCASFVSLLVGLAWPATVLLLAYQLVQHADGMLKSLSTLMQDKQSLEVGVGPKDGLIIKIVQQQVQNGLIQQIRADPHLGDQANKLQQAERTAATATSQLVPHGLRRPETVVKVLWVDDHPQNNIGLQYAFEALGLTVICIEGDARIPEAFTTAGGFDVVITDIFRDAMWGRPEDPEAGLKTVDIIRNEYSNVPVIIYSGSDWAAAHRSESVSKPVIATTDDPQHVLTVVAGIASKKTK